MTQLFLTLCGEGKRVDCSESVYVPLELHKAHGAAVTEQQLRDHYDFADTYCWAAVESFPGLDRTITKALDHWYKLHGTDETAENPS